MRTAFLLLLMVASSAAVAEPRWPTSDLQDWIDYRAPAPLSANTDLSSYFKDVPYPKGILFSTQTGSIYWYDADKDTVTCLLPLNGTVDGLSMTADRSLYAFSWNGQPYLWRPGTQPGINLIKLNVGSAGPGNAFELDLNATGTVALLTNWWSDAYESGRHITLVDLKTMTTLKDQEGGSWDFTPDGAFLVEEGYDYENPDTDGEPARYAELFSIRGVSVKRFATELEKAEGRFDARSRWDGSPKRVPEWYQNRPSAEGGLDTWGGLDLPATPEQMSENFSHPAGQSDGLLVDIDSNLLTLTRLYPEGSWTRKMRTYGGGISVWLDAKGKTLLVLTSRPGPPQYDGFPGPLAALRQYDWRSGERSATDIVLTSDHVDSIQAWEPGVYAELLLADGGRLEYSFKTQKIVTGNGTTPLHGRAITSFFTSMTGSLSFDKAGKVLTLPRFAGQLGGLTSFRVREDQRLVATMDEAGQVAIRRVDDGETLAITRFHAGVLDLAPLAEFTEDDFVGVFAAPAASSEYRTTSAKLTAGPGTGK